jgi:hypothetical protein
MLNDPKLSKENVIDLEKLEQERKKREIKEKQKKEMKSKIVEKKKMRNDDGTIIFICC